MTMAHAAAASEHLTHACDTHYPWQTEQDEGQHADPEASENRMHAHRPGVATNKVTQADQAVGGLGVAEDPGFAFGALGRGVPEAVLRFEPDLVQLWESRQQPLPHLVD